MREGRGPAQGGLLSPCEAGPAGKTPGRGAGRTGAARQCDMASNSPWHACSQAAQASAHTRQCACISAWLRHSSPQARQAAMQARSCASIRPLLGFVRRETTAPVAAQTSAQSRSSRMQYRSSATMPSDRQASAQTVQAVAQSWHASMQAWMAAIDDGCCGCVRSMSGRW